MYCPRCGNHPSTDRVRFCPSCGFRLDGVVDLLAHDGIPTNPLIVPQATRSNELSQRRRGIRIGAKMIFFSLVSFLPILAFSVGVVDSAAPLIVPLVVFFAGIFWVLYYRLFGEDYPPQKENRYFGPPPPQQVYNPPQQSVPVYRTPMDTPSQQSVVENTTRSLGQQ